MNMFLESNSLYTFDKEYLELVTEQNLLLEESKALAVIYNNDKDYSDSKASDTPKKKAFKKRVSELIEKIKEYIRKWSKFIQEKLSNLWSFIKLDEYNKLKVTSLKMVHFNTDTTFPLFDFQCMYTMFRNIEMAIDNLYTKISQGKTLKDDYLINEFVQDCTNKQAETPKELYDYISDNLIKPIKIKAKQSLPSEVIKSVMETCNYATKKEYMGFDKKKFFGVSSAIDRYCDNCKKLIMQDPPNLNDIQGSIQFLQLFQKEVYILINKLYTPYNQLVKLIYKIATGMPVI